LGVGVRELVGPSEGHEVGKIIAALFVEGLPRSLVPRTLEAETPVSRRQARFSDDHAPPWIDDEAACL
jgi:hypothetical protein